MSTQRLLVAATVANFGLLLVLALQAIRPADAATGVGVLRGSGLEIVDDQGRLRATLNLQPPSGTETETVLFRLINPDGQPSVKIAASTTGSGLSFVGGDDESYLILKADGPEGYLKIVEPEGREQVVTP